jgi:hypothetical protein
MKGWLRRIRGAIGIGLTWALGWAPIGALVGLIVGAVFGFPLGGIAVDYAELFAVLGLIGGGLFSTVLRVTERSRRFDELSLPRFTAWGALGGLVLGGLALGVSVVGLELNLIGWSTIAMAGLLGAGSAAATLSIARAADDRALLDEGESVDEVELTGEEVRRLLAE